MGMEGGEEETRQQDKEEEEAEVEGEEEGAAAAITDLILHLHLLLLQGGVLATTSRVLLRIKMSTLGQKGLVPWIRRRHIHHYLLPLLHLPPPRCLLRKPKPEQGRILYLL